MLKAARIRAVSRSPLSRVITKFSWVIVGPKTGGSLVFTSGRPPGPPAGLPEMTRRLCFWSGLAPDLLGTPQAITLEVFVCTPSPGSNVAAGGSPAQPNSTDTETSQKTTGAANAFCAEKSEATSSAIVPALAHIVQRLDLIDLPPHGMRVNH